MANLLKRFESWGGRWQAVAVVVAIFATFHLSEMLAVNWGTSEPYGIFLLLTLLSTVIVAVKYVVLGFASLPVYKNNHAIAMGFGITLAVAVLADITMYALEIFRVMNIDLSVAYRTHTFSIAGLLVIMLVVLYLVFNEDTRKVVKQ